MRERPAGPVPERTGAEPTRVDGDKRYDAFVSYSRLDEHLAVSIQRGLHRVGRSAGELRALRVFRDATDLHAGALAEQIEAALARSTFFILVASPNAAASRWVSKELEFWLEHFGPDRLLLVLADGELHWDDERSCFDELNSSAAPTPLRRPASIEAEPAYVDFRQCANETVSDRLFREQLVDVAAPIHGVPRERLSSEDRRLQRRTRRLRNIAVTSLAVLFVIAVAAALFARNQQVAAESQSRRATALGLSGQARALIADDPLVALALSAEAVLATDVPTGESLATMIESAAAVRAQRWAPAVPPITVHDAAITQLVLDPTGTLLVSADGDGVVWMTDAVTGNVRAGPVFPPEDAVVVLAVSPNGEVLAAGTEAGDLRAVDIATGDDVFVSSGVKHRGRVTDLDFSPDGELLVSGGEDGTVRVSAIGGGRPSWVAALEPATGNDVVSVQDVAFSPSGSLIAAAGDGAPTAVWETVTGVLTARTNATVSTSDVSVAFSPDESLLATGDRGNVYVWERAGYLRAVDQDLPIGAWRSEVNELTFGEDGSLTAFSPDAVRRWDLGSRTPTAPPIEVHDTSILDVAIASDAELIVTADQGGAVRRWNPATGQQLGAPLRGHTSAVARVAVSATGDRIFSADSDGTIQMWSQRDSEEADRAVHAHDDGGSGIAMSPDGAILATGYDDGSVQLRDANTFELIQHFDTDVPGRLNDASWLEFSRDGDLLIAVDRSAFAVRHWTKVGGDWTGATHTIDQDCVDNFNCSIWDVKLDPSGQFLAIRTLDSEGDNAVTMLDVRTGRVGWRQRNATAFAFAPDDAIIAVGTGRDVELRDTVTGRVLTTWRHALDDVRFLHVMPDDDVIAADWDGTIKVWNPDTRSSSDMTRPGGPDRFLRSRVTHDGPPPLAIAPHDAESDIVIEMEVESGRLQTRPVTGPIEELIEIAISRDDELIASADGRGRIQLWTARTAEPIGQPLTGSGPAVGGLSFSPTGDTLVAVMGDGTLRSWRLPDDVASACDLLAGRVGLRQLMPYVPEGFEPQACQAGA